MPVPPTPRLTRRAALAAATGTLVGLVGCTPNSANAPPRRATRRRVAAPDPDVALAATVLADERDLLDRIDATLERHPGLGTLLTPTRDAHQAHVDLLQDAAPDEPSSSVVPSPSVEPSPGDATPEEPVADAVVRVPRDRRRAVLALARRADEVALVDKRSAFAAESGAFARVLASMAASAAQQAAVLRAAVPDRTEGAG